MEILTFYKQVLADLNIYATEDGMLEISRLGGNKFPFNVTVLRGDQRLTLPLVLPTPDICKMEEDGTMIKFHPLGESVFRGQSPVLNALISQAANEVMLKVGLCWATLVSKSLDPKAIKGASNALLKLMEGLPAITDDKKIDNATKYCKQLLDASKGITGEKAIIKLSMRRDSGNSSTRSLVATVPALKDGDIYGVKSKAKYCTELARQAFRAVCNVSEHVTIVAQHSSMSAPYLLALLKGLASVLAHLNTVANVLGLHKSDKFSVAKLGWVPALETIEETYARELPVPFEGNEGVGGTGEQAAAANQNVAVNTKPVDTSTIEVPVVTQPAHTNQSTVAPAAAPVKTVSAEDMRNSMMSGLQANYNNAATTPMVADPKPSTAITPINQSPATTSPVNQAVTSPVNQQASQQPTSAVATQATNVQVAQTPQVAAQATQQPAQSNVAVASTPTINNNLVAFNDFKGNLVTLANGQPYQIPEAAVPQVPVGVKTNPFGQVDYHQDGTPILIQMNALGQPVGEYPLQQLLAQAGMVPMNVAGYPQPAYPQQGYPQQGYPHAGYPQANVMQPGTQGMTAEQMIHANYAAQQQANMASGAYGGYGPQANMNGRFAHRGY